MNINPGEAVYPITSTTYYVGDHLGSTRLELAGSGWPVSSNTFYPFGQEQSPTADPNHYKFTGKERDAESGLDYFGARYMSSNMGRFMSPDPTVMSKELGNPQSWNKYSYTFNNPLKLVDPDGKWPKEYHHQIIDWQYHQYGEHATAILKNASDEVDGMRGQLAHNSPAHHMTSYWQMLRDPQQAKFDAQMEWSHFIDDNMRSAAKAEIAWEKAGKEGTSDDFWRFYGYALHATTDAASLEHEDFQPWSMVNLFGVAQHVGEEDWDARSASPSAVRHRGDANRRSAELWQRMQFLLDQMRQQEQKK